MNEILDAIPSLIFVVDKDMRIFDVNKAASEYVALPPELMYQKKGGDILICLNSAADRGGCGRAQSCGDCLIRNSVSKTFKTNETVRSKNKLKLLTKNGVTDVFLYVTTAPLNYKGQDNLVLLILDDITELAELNRLLPICASCKKIRDDKGYWNQLEEYIKDYSGTKFSHGVCPDCIKKLYPDLDLSKKDKGN